MYDIEVAITSFLIKNVIRYEMLTKCGLDI